MQSPRSLPTTKLHYYFRDFRFSFGFDFIKKTREKKTTEIETETKLHEIPLCISYFTPWQIIAACKVLNNRI